MSQHMLTAESSVEALAATSRRTSSYGDSWKGVWIVFLSGWWNGIGEGGVEIVAKWSGKGNMEYSC